jgi:hypothetical protein
VTDDVGVGVAVEAELEWDGDAGKNQRPSGDETMQVVSVSNSHGQRRLESGGLSRR